MHEDKYHEEVALNNVALKLKSNYEKILKYTEKMQKQPHPKHQKTAGNARKTKNEKMIDF